MDQTVNQFGIVVGGLDERTIVAFPAPIFYRYVYKNSFLSKVHDEEFSHSLQVMKKLVLDAVKTREQKDDVVALGSDVFENRLRTLELRAAALEYAREI